MSHLRLYVSSESRAKYCGGLRRENAEDMSENAKATSRCKSARAARGYRERSVGATVLGAAAVDVDANIGALLAFVGDGAGDNIVSVIVAVDIARRAERNVVDARSALLLWVPSLLACRIWKSSASEAPSQLTSKFFLSFLRNEHILNTQNSYSS